MTLLSSMRPRVLIAVIGLIALGIGAYFYWGCRKPPVKPLPGRDSPSYQQYAEHFELGTAAVDASVEADMASLAREKLTAAIEAIPEEPAAWANRGLLFLRRNQLKEAAADLQQADKLAPKDPEIEILLGLLASKQGQYDAAVSHLRTAVEQKPEDLAARYKLAEQIVNANAAGCDADAQKVLEEILRVQPSNMFILVKRAEHAALAKDRDAVNDSLARLTTLAVDWPAGTREILEEAKKEAATKLPGGVPVVLSRLLQHLVLVRGYLRSFNAINRAEAFAGSPLQRFRRLEPLRNTPSGADLGLTFTHERIGDAAGKWDVVLPVWLKGNGNPAVFAANAKQVRRIDAKGFEQVFPSGEREVQPTLHGILSLDLKNTNRSDIVLAGAGGLRFFEQNAEGDFTDVTAKTGLPPAILKGDYHGAWAADYEMDGDLDIVVAPRNGPPFVLRNNREGTFTVVKPFAGIDTARDFVWADLDNDGAPDAAFLDTKGQLHVFLNERLGTFKRHKPAENLGRFLALTVADLNDDGVFDLAALRADGAVLRISDHDRGASLESTEIVRWSNVPEDAEPGTVRLLVADLDGNGGMDLLASGPRGAQVWLNEEPGRFTPLAALSAPVFAIEDLTGKGRNDLLSLDEQGRPQRLANHGTRGYHWMGVRGVADEFARGDDRINSFGIGGEVEIRVGTLSQKQRITSPRTLFGLGERKLAHLVRFVWTNGTAQVEIAGSGNLRTGDAAGDQTVSLVQRLGGSCPFLFTWNGKEVQFVADFMWSTPLGMFIGGQEKGGFLQTQDWVKVRGDQLVPRDGYYDIRVQANLWETHFFDHMSLIVVDHPPETEVFVDERFALTPMVPQVHVTSPPKPVARAWDHKGDDVTELVRAIDGRYLDTCGRGRFQGITRDHWVEIDLGDDAPREGPLWLLAHGWIHPTDSSINVAIAQGKHEQPRPLVLEIPDGKGGWKVGRDAIGFPAGKNKTIMIRLDGITGKEVTRRFRLRTNLEIFWDGLHYATSLEPKLARQTRLGPDVADLRFRGFLPMTRANDSSPELPHYDKVSGEGQRWRDLIGFHTRYGDVRELLAKIDDRYVIVNAGDEIAMRFAVPAAPPPGWKRDFVWVCEGWVKDGNLNTAFSKTVLPLPSHDMTRYDRPPGALEDDPVYKRFPDDWKKYHTRYITPSTFERGLRSFRR